MISGGTSINTIASRASLELDLRSISVATLTTMSDEVICAVKAANRPGIRCQVEVIGQRPAGEIPLRHPLVQLADRSLRKIGFSPVFGVGSTDANIPLSRGYPAICIGLTTGTGAHTTDEFIRTPPLAKGLEHLYHIVTHVWDEV
jgi:acetylornithine deacetylase/succinyl-diaminopimelate desuccinylase-like protein